MAALNSKYHIKIGDFGFLLAKQARTERHIYTREEAPAFVNKFSSGEPNYRDSTFFPHWVQLNWLNGFNQEFFEDGGKFFRSSAVDPTEQQKLKLQKKFSSAGNIATGVKVLSQEAWRASLSTFSIGLTAASSQYLSAAGSTSLNIIGALTVEAWVKFTSTPSSGNLFGIVTKEDGTVNSPWGFFLQNSGGTLKLYFETRDSTITAHSGSVNWTPSLSVWYHVAAVFDATGNLLFYVNGIQQGATQTGMGTDIISSTSIANFIGAFNSVTPTGFFNGNIDDARVWAAVRSAAEILANYQSELSGSETNLKAYWKLDNSLVDTTANANTLTAIASPTFSADVPFGGTPSSNFTHLVGGSDGKIYSWDGVSVYTELFDTRRIEWFETGTNLDRIIGDQAGTERAQSQSFQVDANVKIKALQVSLKLNAGTPGDITVRIETNNAGVPSGTLVHADATATITAFTTTSYGWLTATFATAVSLSGSTVYWLVLKTAAAANDNNYAWASKSTSGYADGNMANSADGGGTWAAAATEDAYFRILGNTTSVNVMMVSSLSGSNKAYFGTGDPDGVDNGDARLYDYNGTDFSLKKIFNTTNESSILSMREFGATTPRCYIGFGHKAKIYTTTDFTTFTLAKTITVPNNPGYVFAMAEYNNKLFVGGGYPEQLPTTSFQYSGFLYSYDEFAWVNVAPFEHTVIKSMEVFDTLMFIGTIKRRLYVYNTASIDKLFEFPWDVQITDMHKWDDKLALALSPTPGSAASGFEGIYLFDRNGFHNAFNVSSRSWHSVFTFNNNLMGGNDNGDVYQTSSTTYQVSGTLQTSYEEASLPSIEKIRRSLQLFYESLPTGCSIQVEYKTDESDSAWTSLGTANTVGSTTASFNFASGTYSKKISFRVTLATSTPANTPTLKKIIQKYVLSPDFKYLWKMKLLCTDDIVWQDGTEPAALLNADVSANATSITLKSSNDATPTAGFPDPNGGVMYASIINISTGARDRFSYTGKTDTTLTGIPSSGQYAILAHSANDPVKVTGGDLHQKILDLKQTRQLFTFTDIDAITYTVLFHSYQSDDWSINQDDYYGGLENEVPITLLEA